MARTDTFKNEEIRTPAGSQFFSLLHQGKDMQKEVAMYRRFLNELLFVYNDDHPQQALRRRIKAALAGDWDTALVISKLVVDWNEYATEGVENNEFSGEQDTDLSILVVLLRLIAHIQ